MKTRALFPRRGLVALFVLLLTGALLLGAMPAVVLAGITPTPTPTLTPMTPQVTATPTSTRPVQTPTPAPQDTPTPTVTITPVWILPETGEFSTGVAALWLMLAGLAALLLLAALGVRRLWEDSRTPPT